MVTRMDRDVGRIMKLRAELKIDDNTIVFFTSDNGPIFPLQQADYFHSSGPLRGRKQQMYEGGIASPASRAGPAGSPPARRVICPVYFADFLHTAAELAGARAPSGLDGMSGVPTLPGAKAAGREQSLHEFMYWELPTYNARTRTFPTESPLQAVR